MALLSSMYQNILELLWAILRVDAKALEGGFLVDAEPEKLAVHVNQFLHVQDVEEGLEVSADSGANLPGFMARTQRCIAQTFVTGPLYPVQVSVSPVNPHR